MEFVSDITGVLVLAATEGEESGGSFLVTPGLGLMIWTVAAFLFTMFVLSKAAFPKIREMLEERAAQINTDLDAAAKQRQEADELLEEYRARLREAREQAEDIVARARKASDNLKDETKAEASKQREEMLAAARRDIEHETRRALDELRKEVADLTVVATEKITRKALDEEDHRRLIEEALSEVDFSELAPSSPKGNSG